MVKDAYLSQLILFLIMKCNERKLQLNGENIFFLLHLIMCALLTPLFFLLVFLFAMCYT